MDRVWGLNASSTAPAKPASLEIGYPRASGVATTPGYWWYYMVTETLRNPIVSAGLTPSADAMDQLTQAIEVIAKRNNITGSIQPVRLMDTVGVALSGSQTIDGVTPGNNVRVLRNVAGDAINNGVWLVNTSGAWTRPTDWSTGAAILDGVLVEVGNGSTYANKLFMMDSIGGAGSVTVGTSGCNFIEVTAGVTAALANYLTIANAASTYLTQSAAATTYATNAAIAAFITTSAADAKYLTKTAAASTYATLAALDPYLTAAAANATYALKSDIANFVTAAQVAATYVTQSGAAAYYAPISSLNSYLSKSEAAGSYLTQAAAASTYLTASALGAYLTSAAAAATYATQSSLGAYLTTANAAATYYPKSGGAISGNVSVSGSITATGDITYSASDIRLKVNHKLIEDAMARLRHMGGWTYDWDLAKCQEIGFTPTHEHDIGLFAQRVQEVLPQAVAPAAFGEDYLTVKYEKVVPLLVRALVQQDDTIADLTTQVARLSAQLGNQGIRYGV